MSNPPRQALGWTADAAPGFARLDAEPFPVFEPGTVWLVGAGPGAPGLMSLMAYHAMQHADVVVYDALVNPDILRWVRPGASLEYAGKRGGKPSAKQPDISLRLVQLALTELNAGHPARRAKVAAEDEKAWRMLQLLTSKPALYVSNVDEASAATGNDMSRLVAERAQRDGADHVVISAQIESEIAMLDEAERGEFLETLGLAEPA